MVDRYCNSCVHHIQADPVNLFCMDCLMDPELPGWESDVNSYVAAIDERHPPLRGTRKELEEDAEKLRKQVAHQVAILSGAEEKNWLYGEMLHDLPLPRGTSAQSHKESLLESILNTFSGWLISLVLWMFVIAPAFGIHSSLTESALINGIFTGISIVREYFWRRLFVNKFWRKND